MRAHINLNDYVWVELNDYGWECIEKHYRELFNQQDVSEFVDLFKSRTSEQWVDGGKKLVTEMQLHELMNLLGNKMYCGGNSVIVNNNVYLTVDRI